MATYYANLIWHLEYTGADGQSVRLGNAGDAVRIATGTGVRHHKSFSVAAAATQKIYDAADGPSDFDFLVVISDTAGVYLESVTDDNNGVGQMVFTNYLEADWPYLLGRNLSHALATESFATGTVDRLEKLTVKNTASTTAIVTILVGT